MSRQQAETESGNEINIPMCAASGLSALLTVTACAHLGLGLIPALAFVGAGASYGWLRAKHLAYAGMAVAGLISAPSVLPALENAFDAVEDNPIVLTYSAAAVAGWAGTRGLNGWINGDEEVSEAVQKLQVSYRIKKEKVAYQTAVDALGIDFKTAQHVHRMTAVERANQWMLENTPPAHHAWHRKQHGLPRLKEDSWLDEIPVADVLPGSEPAALFSGPADADHLPTHLTFVPQEVEQEEGLMFPVVDLAAEMAESFLDVNSASSILIACPRRTGKTSLLESLIAHFHRVTEGTGQINVFNGKETRKEDGTLKDDFCGLAYEPKRYLAVESPDAALEMFERLSDIGEKMLVPRNYFILNILDEYNNMLIQAEAYDLTVPTSGKITKQLTSKTTHRATAGSSRKMVDVITSHSPYVSDIKINKMMQDNFLQVFLARGEFTHAINKALSGGTGGQKSVVSDEVLCAKLLAEFQAWAATKDEDHVLALTNLGGWRLVFLPKKGQSIRLATGKKQVANPQSNSQSEPSKPSLSSPPTSEEVTQALQRWIHNSGAPSDEDLLKMFCRFSEISEESIPDPQATLLQLKRKLKW